MSQLSIQKLQELITDKKVDTIVLGFADPLWSVNG